MKTMSKSNVMTEVKLCPRCNKHYTAPSAISRRDNKEVICPLCGTKEALFDAGYNEDEIERIIVSVTKSLDE